VQPISTDRLIGYNDLDEASAGWVGEVSSRPETGTGDVPGRYEIPAHELYANPRASQNLLDDAVVDIEAWLAKKVAGKLARVEAAAFVSGNGVAKPRGFTTYAHASAPTKANWQRIEYTKTGVNGAFAASAPADIFITAIGLMKEPLLGGSVFGMNRATKAGVRKLKDGQGNYLVLPDFREGFRETLLGYPIVGMEDMATYTTTAADAIVFGNFAEAYTIADRQGIRVLRDPFTAKPFVQFYTTARVGGDVVNFEALKLIRFGA
jgi:HK97 family phage major capsid protein